mmetsp:Transcript_16891/g.26311  ORF Transcript_16891/g.26311 Transcript_16891/m.26311 type:complete len:753 (-) Transcript_16891:30-2288(-)
MLSKKNVFTEQKFVQLLSDFYSDIFLPLEKKFLFWEGQLSAPTFTSPPMVLLLGPYSTGKTTFVQHFLGRYDAKPLRTGPEPITDKFTAVMLDQSGQDGRVTPGHLLTNDTSLPFGDLNDLGSEFLRFFQCVSLTCPMLEHVYFVDTPGMLAGSTNRQYNFLETCQSFADKASLILVFFDTTKLDISEECEKIVRSLASSGHMSKVRVVLNKADQVRARDFLQVYGATTWMLSRLFQTHEILKLYCASFWHEDINPKCSPEFRSLIEEDHAVIFAEIAKLKSNRPMQLLDMLWQRYERLKAHCLLTDHIRSEIPMLFGIEDAQNRIFNSLPETILNCSRIFGLPTSHFPPVDKYRKMLMMFPSYKDLPTLSDRQRKLLEGIGGKLKGFVQKWKETQVHSSDMKSLAQFNKKQQNLKKSPSSPKPSPPVHRKTPPRQSNPKSKSNQNLSSSSSSSPSSSSSSSSTPRSKSNQNLSSSSPSSSSPSSSPSSSSSSSSSSLSAPKSKSNQNPSSSSTSSSSPSSSSPSSQSLPKSPSIEDISPSPSPSQSFPKSPSLEDISSSPAPFPSSPSSPSSSSPLSSPPSSPSSFLPTPSSPTPSPSPPSPSQSLPLSPSPEDISSAPAPSPSSPSPSSPPSSPPVSPSSFLPTPSSPTLLYPKLPSPSSPQLSPSLSSPPSSPLPSSPSPSSPSPSSPSNSPECTPSLSVPSLNPFDEIFSEQPESEPLLAGQIVEQTLEPQMSEVQQSALFGDLSNAL